MTSPERATQGGALFLTVLVGVLALSAGGSERDKKLIEFGWDEPDTRFMREHIAEMQASPFAQQLRRMSQLWPRLLEMPDGVTDTLVDVVSSLPFERFADLQDAEQLLAEMIREGATPRSAFHTPQAAIDLMIEVAQPMPGEVEPPVPVICATVPVPERVAPGRTVTGLTALVPWTVSRPP